jgi:hypothetical protein
MIMGCNNVDLDGSISEVYLKRAEEDAIPESKRKPR